MIPYEHKKEIANIAIYCKLDYKKVEETYNRKISQYVNREYFSLKKSGKLKDEWFNENGAYGDKVLNIMYRYINMHNKGNIAFYSSIK